MVHLFERILRSKQENKPVRSKYKIVWEDPYEPGEPAKVTTPDPHFMAAAMAGDVLPPIEAYLADRVIERSWHRDMLERGEPNTCFNWEAVGGASHPYADPIGPMTEEEAIEYLIQKDIPPRVWRDYRGNRKILSIVPIEAVPTDRTNRNAWKIDQMEINQ